MQDLLPLSVESSDLSTLLPHNSRRDCKNTKTTRNGAVQTFATPRRVMLPYRYPERPAEQTITGPPVKAACKMGNQPKPPLFCKSRGKAVEDLITVESKRGPVIGLQIQSGVKTNWKSLPSFEYARNGFSSANGLGDGSIKWQDHYIILLLSTTVTYYRLIQTYKHQTRVRVIDFSDVFEVNSAESWKENLNQNCVLADKEDRRTK